MAGNARTANTRAAANKAKAGTEKMERIENEAANTNTVERPQETEPQTERRKAYKVADNLDPNMYVPVRNGFNGKLIYKSRRTGERYVWDHFGDEQDMELRELRAAKTSYKSFYENNWFLIDDPEVIAYLGVEKYYANALSFDDFDKLFDNTPEEIARRIEGLSNGQKASLKYRAKQMINDGAIDSIKVINTLERALGVELIEK